MFYCLFIYIHTYIYIYIYICICLISTMISNYIGKRWVCTVCDVNFEHESKLKRHKASEKHAKYLDMLSVLEDGNSSKEVASEPFEIEELCSEDCDKVSIIFIHKYVYTQHLFLRQISLMHSGGS